MQPQHFVFFGRSNLTRSQFVPPQHQTHSGSGKGVTKAAGERAISDSADHFAHLMAFFSPPLVRPPVANPSEVQPLIPTGCNLPRVLHHPLEATTPTLATSPAPPRWP